MPRTARVVFPGYLYHVTQRGNNKQFIFERDEDYIFYYPEGQNTTALAVDEC